MADDVRTEPDEVVDLTDNAPVAGENGLRWRRVIAGILAVLAILAVVAAVQALWLKTTLENEDQFVSTFEPLPQQDAVAEALSIRVAAGVVEGERVEAFVADTLPSELSFIAVPITGAIQGVVASAANDLIQSDEFASIWSVTLRGTHVAVSAVLSGNDRALESEDGQVAINLDAIAAEVVARLEARGLNLPDAEVELGSVVIFESDELAAAQTVAQGISAVGWFLPLIAILLIAGAIWAAANKRRMVAILAFGSAIALLISLATLRFTQNALLDDMESEVIRDAAEAVWDTTLARLIAGTWALIVLALIVGFLAWLSGPSARAQGMRSRGANAVEGWRRPIEQEPSDFMAFLAEWKRSIQVVIAVLGLLFVLFGPTPSGWLVLITTAVVLGLGLLVEVFAGPARDPEDAEV